jgi:hypothetical protein
LEIHAPRLEELPRDWAAYPRPPSTQAFGLRWIREARAPLLGVPSAVYRPANAVDRSYLLNLGHPAAPGSLFPSSSAPFSFAAPFVELVRRVARAALKE